MPKMSFVPGHVVASDSSRLILGQTVAGIMFTNSGVSEPKVMWGLLPLPPRSVVSVVSSGSGNTVTIAPNPSFGVVYIRGAREATLIDVMDVNGRIVMTCTADESATDVELDLSPFPTGAYSITLTGRSHRSAYVVIKL